MDNIKSEEIKDIKIPFSENFILLFATNNSFKLFKETTTHIDTSQPPLLNDKRKKYLKLYQKGEKDYKSEENTIEEIMPKETKYSIFNWNCNYLNYLIKEINKDKNWTAKIIYFDMHFDLIVPKCEIASGLK